MDSNLQGGRLIDHILTAIWRNWAIATGALMLPLILALFVPKLWLPFICVAESYLLISMMRADITSGISSCSLIIRLVSRALLITAAVMFIIAILCTDWLVPTVIHIELYNSEIPFITCLVASPVTVGLCIMYTFFGIGERYARESQRRNGFYAGDSVTATIYYYESKYQIQILFIVSFLLGIVEYWYYFSRYINANLNLPDRLVFNYMPLAMYVVSLFFIAGRYAAVRRSYIELEATSAIKSNSTLVRFLVISGNEIVLTCKNDGRWDTPVEIVTGRCRAIPEHQARSIIKSKIDIEKFELRYCYTNDGFAEGSNIIHYAMFIEPEICESMGNNWMHFDAGMIDTALSANAIASLLAAELYRIHTMTMAWKTYKPDGSRRYPIKHYRPSFRICDMPKWTIDYDDLTWFEIAHNNEDRTFFKMRRFWLRITSIFRRNTKSTTGQ